MNLKILLIDVDDVTAQFRRKFVDMANNILGTEISFESSLHCYEIEKGMNLTKAQNSKVWVEVNKKGFASSLDLMPGAGDAVENLSKKYEVMFLTSPLKSSDTWVSDRRRWMRKHFGRVLEDSIITTKSKFAVDGDYFIDDRPEMINKWTSERLRRCGSHSTPKPMLYAWPYNEGTPAPRFRSWEDITKDLL